MRALRLARQAVQVPRMPVARPRRAARRQLAARVMEALPEVREAASRLAAVADETLDLVHAWRPSQRPH
ncbi:MAG TPA: hypothetical protein VM433_09255 [Mycobacteriales bacterium]|nr:hypothetical protein [Mycobacteriales bacterium]